MPGHFSVEINSQAVARSISLHALKGGYWYQKLFTDLVRIAEREKLDWEKEWASGLMDYKIRAQDEVDRRTKLGKDCSDIVPHPDQIILDLHNNDFRVIGPVTKEERDKFVANYEEFWTDTIETLQWGKERNDELRRQLDDECNPRRRKRLQKKVDEQKEAALLFQERSEEILKILRPFGYVETRPSWEWPE
jgi:hypothetical protein